MEKVFQLTYVSQASETISYTDLKNILWISKERNVQDHITGVLIFRDGLFMQLLEGTKVSVLNTLSRIIRDQRHNHLKVLLERFADRRIFENWSMAFLDGDISGIHEENLQKIFSDAFLLAPVENRTLMLELEHLSYNPLSLL